MCIRDSAGYARIATLGEEVADPARTIPRAITGALGITFAVYLLVGSAAVGSLGPTALAASAAPLVEVAALGGSGWPVAVTRMGAAAAALGALLAMVAGIGRTTLAMARHGDLPGWLAAVHPRFRVPHRAELAVGAAVSVLVTLTDLRGAIGFSSFGVLLYYFIANLAALRQERGRRRYPPVSVSYTHLRWWWSPRSRRHETPQPRPRRSAGEGPPARSACLHRLGGRWPAR